MELATKSETGRTIYPKIGIWYNEKDGHIRIGIEGHAPTSVTDDPASKRGNPSLYKKLARVLRDAGAKYPPGI